VLKAESESSDLSQKTFLIKARGITMIHMVKLPLRGTTIYYTYPERISEYFMQFKVQFFNKIF